MDLVTSLAVGEKDCPFKDVVGVFFNEVNSGTVFKIWKDFARELGIESYQIDEWRHDKQLDKLTVKDIFHKILESWKKEKGKEATLPSLLKHLENVKLKNVADDLTKLFSTVNPEHKDSGPIFKSTLPNKPTHYIPRSLKTRRVIDAQVFSSSHKDVFVLDGIDRYRLSQLAQKELTDASTEQVRKHQLSVRFIFLQHFGDWALLCKKTTNPIHLIRHRGGRFHWICTKGDISALQQFSDEETQNELSEEEFIRDNKADIQFQSNQPICISDSPGMGKSLLLASIGRQLQQRYPHRCIAFIVISEFAVKIRELLPKFKNTEKAVLEALTYILCGNTSAIEQLAQKMTTPAKNPSTQFELMFDGFDEVSTQNLDLALECLEILKTNFNSSTRVWVTTRPQHLHKLEKRFSVLGYKIEAFQEKHQIDFLSSFWNSPGLNLDKNKLESYSKNCLIKLKQKLNKKDEDIAGIPLQCMMIADVYMQEAHRFCDSKNNNIENRTQPIPCIEVTSIAGLYKKMIAYKIKKFMGTYPLQPEEIRNIWPLHVYLALELIFPSHAHQFMDTLQIDSGLNMEHLVNIGILEHRGGTTEDSMRFIHRTFAEYLAARFFVSYVIAPSTAGLQSSTQPLNFIFKPVLECSVEKGGSQSYYECSFKHPVLCHFLEVLLPSQTPASVEIFISQESTDYIRDLLYASIHSDFLNIIRFLHSLKYPESFSIHCFDSKILIDATTLASSELLQFLLESFEHEPLTAIEVESDIFPRTPLHAAVIRGNFSIFEYILKEHDFEDLVRENEQFLDVVFCAVENTIRNVPDEIQDRVQILTTLCYLNSKMLNYHSPDDPFKRSPLLADRVNIVLLKKLIQWGANVLQCDIHKSTILHTATDYLSPSEYYDLLQYILQFTSKATFNSLIQMRNCRGETCLHLIVKSGLATAEILNLILSNGLDINASGGGLNETCLFYAVRIENEDRKIATVKLLLENGANCTSVRSGGDSILHYSVEMGWFDWLQFFLEEKKMNIDQVNANGDSPLFHALRDRDSARRETVEFLLERGAEYRILKANRNNILHYSVMFRRLECLKVFIELPGLYINQQNEDGNTPLLCAATEKIGFSCVIGKIEVEIIKLLLSNGADPSICNKYGNNILHLLSKGTYAEESEFNLLLGNVKQLLSFGADVNARNNDGDTPLDIYQREMLKRQWNKELMKIDLTIRRLLKGSGRKCCSVKCSVQ